MWIADSKIEFNDPFFLTDHKLLLDADPPTALYGLPVAWLGYTTALPASLAQSFTITVSGYPTANRDVAIRFALTDTSPIIVNAVAQTGMMDRQSLRESIEQGLTSRCGSCGCMAPR